MAPNQFLKLSFDCINLGNVTHIEDEILNNSSRKSVTVHLIGGESIRIWNPADLEQLKKHLHFVNQTDEVMD